MKKKYNIGDIVFAKSNPAVRLIVCEAITGYYCKELEGPIRAPQIRFEKELLISEMLLTSPKPEPLAVPFKAGALMNIWRNKSDKVKIW